MIELGIFNSYYLFVFASERTDIFGGPSLVTFSLALLLAFL